nr:DUF3667 domain-containing protein [Aliikangiella sp. G2MR2-5]
MYCNSCGQYANTRRINFQYLASEVLNSIFQIERGFLFTLKELFFEPGKCIRNFLDGKRQQYTKPLAYLLLTSSLYIIIAHLLELNTYSKDFAEGFSTGINDSNERDVSGVLMVLNWLASNHAFTLLLTLPLFSLGSYLAFFQCKYNYFEHLILNMYIAGQQMVIYLVVSFAVTKGSFSETLPLIFGMLFNFYVFYQFFNARKPYIRILLFLITYAVFILQLLLLMIVVIALVETLPL